MSGITPAVGVTNSGVLTRHGEENSTKTVRPSTGGTAAFWIGLAVTIALTTAISVYLFQATWWAKTPVLSGTGKDPVLYTWYLVWTPFALTHGYNPLFSNYMLYPHQMNMMWNTSMELIAVIFWPVTAFFGPVGSYNILMTLAPVATGGVTFLALRRHVSAFAAVVGAVFYAFCPELVARENTHVVLAIAFYPPLAWLLLESIVTSPRFRTRALAGFGLGLATFAELMIEPEMLVLTAVGIGLGCVIVAVLNRDALLFRLPWSVCSLAIALVTFLILGAIPLGAMLFGPGRLSGPAQPPDIYVEDVAALLVPGGRQAVQVPWSNMYLLFSGATVETSGYFGPFLLAALIVITVIGWRSLRVRWAAFMTVTLVVLALGPQAHFKGKLTGIPLPWALLQHLPFFDSLLPNRLMIVAFLPVALLLAISVDSLRAIKPPWLALTGALGLFAVGISLLPAPFQAQAVYGPKFFTSPAVNQIRPGSPTAILPMTEVDLAMMWQAESGMRFRILTGRGIVPGESGASAFGVCKTTTGQCVQVSYIPPTLNLHWALTMALNPNLSGRRWTRARNTLIAALRNQNVENIILRQSTFRWMYVKLFHRLLGRNPEWIQGVAVWRAIRLPRR
jgi:hypothetical protein